MARESLLHSFESRASRVPASVNLWMDGTLMWYLLAPLSPNIVLCVSKKRGGGGGECFGSFPVGLADEAPLASY